MHERGKSDGPVVPAKLLNKAVEAAAEVVEERETEPRGTRPAQRIPDAVPGMMTPSGLDRVREVARRDKEARFTALLHHVSLRPAAVGLLGDSPEEPRRGQTG